MRRLRTMPNAAICVLLVLGVGLGCAGMKRPWRDYSAKPFSSAEWKAGDKIERGRMLQSMFRNSAVDLSTRDAAKETLGEPDLKKTIENREVWFYRMDLGIMDAMDVIPISFDEKGRGSVGMAKGGTMSMAAKEGEL